MINKFEETITLEDGRTITIETGKLAKQANGSVVLKMGNTMLLAVVVSDKEAAEGTDFLPLTVEYKEKYASAGRFPGGFLKREARPSDSEILVCRLIDRALRPLFPDDYHANTSVVVNLISHGDDSLPDALACFAASAAIAVSDIPFNGPTSEVRVAKIDGKFVINPSREELEKSNIDMIIAGTLDNINMVEGEMLEISEAEMLEAIKFAHTEIKKQCQLQLNLAAKVEKARTKRDYAHEPAPMTELEAKIRTAIYDKCYAVAKEGHADKALRAEKFKAIKEEAKALLTEEELAQTFLLKKYFHDIEKEAVRDCVLNERTRLDGRKLNEIRPIWSEVDYLPGAHGSAIFTRGETQSLTTVTLGNKMDEQLIDAATYKDTAKFILHYNFPAFSTGEAYPNRGTSRREIGHGNLAMRALKPMIPSGAENPYTIRIVSEILESNGSSSMATVCAGTLALMDAGVQIKRPVSGIAMGLISKGDKYAVLSDILGDEDHLGDMDFKVTGTEKGITACQMDIKVDGLSYQVLEEALAQAREGRLHILGEIAKTMSAPNTDYKPHAPRIIQIEIPKDMIGAVIGPGGKIIQGMQAETGAVITIEEDTARGVGVIDISSSNKESIDKALAKIKSIVAVPEVGEIYEGKVKSIMAFGAFIEILPGKDGLLHISEIDHARLEKVEGVLKEGEMIKVKLIGVDPKTGKMKLSRKVLLPKPENQEN
jgi:polyribonucleotide nucleotidyltransferase